MAAFLDAFQKVADMATNTRGKISVEAEKWKKERKKKRKYCSHGDEVIFE